jgi:hypothetical protein
MASCPDGHESSTDDWCEVCGAPMTAAGPAAAPVGGDSGGSDDLDRGTGTELLALTRPCPVCGSTRPSADRFCERCGFDLAEGSASGWSWVAEVAADRAHYDRLHPLGLTFPAGRATTVVTISAAEVLIGRAHEGRGIHPGIDLSGPLADPGASHRHALLTQLDEGGYTITDLGSTNGTMLNDSRDAVEPGCAHQLADGDRVHIGAWTTITFRRRRM